MSTRLSPSLSIAAAFTGVVVVLLAFTEQYDPAGSPVAWLLVLVLAAVHLPLARPLKRVPVAQVPFPVPARWLYVSALVVVIWGAGALALRHTERIFAEPVLPRGSAQLGLMTQVVHRFTEGNELFGVFLPREGFTEENHFPAGMVLPFAAARTMGFDWRFASLVAVVLLGVMLATAVVALQMSEWRPRDEVDLALATAGIVAAGAAPLFLANTLTMLQWLHTPPLWVLLAGLGLCLAARWHILAALMAGCLAAMNPGWLLMLPVVGALLWKETRSPALFFLLILPPLASYGVSRHEWEEMFRGLLAYQFQAGSEMAAAGRTARTPTLHAVGDVLLLRPALYALALASIAAVTAAMLRAEHRLRRLNLLALAAFVLVALGPVAFFLHWVAHGFLLAGLVPAACLAAATEEGEPAELPLRPPVLAFAAAAAGFLLLVGLVPLRAGVPSITQREEFLLPPGQNLFSGWNITSGDHTWGRAPEMVTGFTLDRPQAGILEIRIGTLGGEFTPYNPFTVRINNRPLGRFFIQPGEVLYARLSLEEDDVVVGFNVVEFDAEWARTPRSVNVYPDDRTVSLIYEGMRFIPRDRLPPEVQLAEQKQTSSSP